MHAIPSACELSESLGQWGKVHNGQGRHAWWRDLGALSLCGSLELISQISCNFCWNGSAIVNTVHSVPQARVSFRSTTLP